MTNQISPHDKLFKVTMSKPHAAKEFLQTYLPAQIKDIVNLDTLQLQKDSFIDEQLKGHLTDLLYSVQFDNQPGYIYLLFEHLSNPNKMIAFRLLKYMVNIMEHHIKKTKKAKLPLVVPLVIYTGNSKYNYSTNLFDLFGANKDLAKNILYNTYQLIDIKDIPDKDLRNQIWIGLMCAAFKTHHVTESLTLTRLLMPNFAVVDQQGDVEFINFVVKYILETREIDNKDYFFETLVTGLSTKTGETIMTTADILRQEGEQRGIQQGIQAGIQQGIQAGIQQGIQAGIQQGIEKVAMSMLEQQLPTEQIAKFTNLPINKIKELAAKQQKH